MLVRIDIVSSNLPFQHIPIGLRSGDCFGVCNIVYYPAVSSNKKQDAQY